MGLSREVCSCTLFYGSWNRQLYLGGSSALSLPRTFPFSWEQLLQVAHSHPLGLVTVSWQVQGRKKMFCSEEVVPMAPPSPKMLVN
uniref:Uncharacterized protein n=1 Tax=Anas platyrhynchos TaxID=8839 RepID=A0A8B9TCS7_ANAPL